MANTVLSYNYQSSNNAPAAGEANQRVNDRSQLAINTTGQAAANNTAFFAALKPGGYIAINGIHFRITAVSVAGSVATLTINPATTALPFGVTNLTFIDSPFPLFKPIFPPPSVEVAGGAPPTFPPPTPPPIGTVPKSGLFGPVVAAAAVPPSVAGIALIRTVSAWTGKFPDFQVTLVTPPPIKFTNTMMIGAAVPPQTATVTQVPVGGWGPPIGPSITPPPLTPRAVLGEEEADVPPPEQLPSPDDEGNGRRRRRKPV